MASFGRPEGTPDFYYFRIPMASGEVDHSFCAHMVGLVHFSFRRGEWINSVRGLEGAAYDFWKSIWNSDVVARHPVLKRRAWHFAVTLGLHGMREVFPNKVATHKDAYDWRPVCIFTNAAGWKQTMQKS